jgi:hypothetical protein
MAAMNPTVSAWRDPPTQPFVVIKVGSTDADRFCRTFSRREKMKCA